MPNDAMEALYPFRFTVLKHAFGQKNRALALPHPLASRALFCPFPFAFMFLP
jgi:hypothetical protein